MSAKQEKAIIILSGGLDSTTCMGIAHHQGYECYPLTFDYGQRHLIEIENAKKVAQFYQANQRHHIVQLDFLSKIGGSALTDQTIDVPHRTGAISKDQSLYDRVIDEKIPVTYVPGRNLLFLAFATSYAEVIGAHKIFIGVNALDYSGYPDCRPEFIQKIEEVIRLATKVGVQGQHIQIMTPLIQWSKADIIREGMRLGVPYHLTTSCYEGKNDACGKCESCYLRLKGFTEAGFQDPIDYAPERGM